MGLEGHKPETVCRLFAAHIFATRLLPFALFLSCALPLLCGREFLQLLCCMFPRCCLTTFRKP